MPDHTTLNTHPEIRQLLDDFKQLLLNTLNSELRGLYLYGSLVWGDFEPDRSDIDLCAVTAHPVDEARLAALKAMHNTFAHAYPAWDDRIEVQYVSPENLRCFREQETVMANISPGEPLHLIPCNIDWLTNWYFVQDYGITLYGPAPETFIPPIAKREFVEAARAHAFYWKEHAGQAADSISYQGYAILTLCRACYTCLTGEQISKRKAAQWAKNQFSEHRALIAQAEKWTRPGGPADDPARQFERTRAFIGFACDWITQNGVF